MEHTSTGTTTQKPPSHPRPAAATTAGITPPPLTTVTQDDHLAAAAYLMKHTSTTALIVTDTQTGQPAGIITQTDITHAIADGKDPNDTRVHTVMTTRPASRTRTIPMRDRAADGRGIPMHAPDDSTTPSRSVTVMRRLIRHGNTGTSMPSGLR